MSENTNYASISIRLASPETIEKEWSYGEVTKSETINYRTQRPERDGLFCERIFGPTKDDECACGKYKKNKGAKKGKLIICDKCGVAVTSKSVRRSRMGHIKLAAPVAHTWYCHSIPSRMSLLLEITPKQLDSVLQYNSYIITDIKESLDHPEFEYKKGQVLTDRENREALKKYDTDIKTGMGAEAILELLKEYTEDKLKELSASIREEIKTSSGQRKTKLIKRLEIIEAFINSGNKPEWMILTVLPVIPPDLRPMVQLDGGRFATSDLNDLYRRVINRNNRLKRLMDLCVPDIMINQEKRMLQDAVDSLIDNAKKKRPVTNSTNTRPLKSLSEFLRGKQGRFRQNLLGKRVDYSGRSVIVVGPELKIYQCGLPKEMALELFKPFIQKRLLETGVTNNKQTAKKMVERGDQKVWDALDVVIKDHPVLLNRAPTLHRLSIQAFEPVLVEGRAIKLHPLVCTPFNADFDGDQMSVHVPLSNEAQTEARFLMLSANNFLKPADGRAVNMPSQDMVMGSYWLTIDKPGEKGEGGIYKDFNEAQMAYSVGELGLHAHIKVRVEKYVAKLKDSDKYVVLGESEEELQRALDEGIYDETTVEKRKAIINATLGRYIFNQSVPQDLGFVNRVIDEKNPSEAFGLEIDYNKHIEEANKNLPDDRKKPQKVPAGKKVLGEIIDKTIKKHDILVTAKVLDAIKANGFKYATKAAVSIAISDVTVPEEKWKIINRTVDEVQQIQDDYDFGMLGEKERYESVIKKWAEATNEVAGVLRNHLGTYNPIKLMADSGARGSNEQILQLAGMRGLMQSATGRTMEIPIKSNFREGLNVLEYFTCARSSRKTLSDTALKTADSGYLTRRLVDVSQEVIVTEEDCGTTEGIWAHDLSDVENKVAEKSVKPTEELSERLPGRYSAQQVVDPVTGEVYVEANQLITPDIAKKIVSAGIKEVYIRSILKCKAKSGICAHCYGSDLASTKDKTIAVGEAVGVIAAQSIGEPGTQLTMRTFHTGGVASSPDITKGLPRVEELFEARPPKREAVISEVTGTYSVADVKAMKEISVLSDNKEDLFKYKVPADAKFLVKPGDHVEKGQILTEGSQNLEEIIEVRGIDSFYDYIIREVQKVYRVSGVNTNDKHIEVIVRQMTRKMTITDPGDTKLLEGYAYDVNEVDEANTEIERRIAEGETDLRKATGKIKLLGITKAAIQTESFLSAASFQETTKVLTDAAIKGKVDHLKGLKENVIVGKLIPAGTGLPAYRDVEIKKTERLENLLKQEATEYIYGDDSYLDYDEGKYNDTDSYDDSYDADSDDSSK